MAGNGALGGLLHAYPRQQCRWLRRAARVLVAAVPALPALRRPGVGRSRRADRNDPAGTGRRAALGQQRALQPRACGLRSEEHTSELQSLMRISYADFCFTKKKNTT